MDKSRGTGTPNSALRLINTTTTTNISSHRSTTPSSSHNSVQAPHDNNTRQARTTTMMTQRVSGNRATAAAAAPRGSFGMVSVALSALLAALAWAPSSVQALTSSQQQQSSCVQITDTGLYSSCVMGGKVTSVAFMMEGTATGALDTVSVRLGDGVGGGVGGGAYVS